MKSEKKVNASFESSFLSNLVEFGLLLITYRNPELEFVTPRITYHKFNTLQIFQYL